VKWAGGKGQLIPRLARFIPSEFGRYFEPFLGGGAFFFYLVSERNLRFGAFLSDINAELINAYKIVKQNADELIELLKVYEREYRKNPTSYYYKLRDEMIPSSGIEGAARFVTLNKTCYNGLYRVNKSGKFNVPIGKYKNPLICDAGNLRNVSLALRHSRATLLLADYGAVLEQASRNDFIYLDPPYKPTSATANFTGYTNTGFNDSDQEELRDIFKKLDKKGCKVLLSNSDTPLVRELYSEFKKSTEKVSAMRAINCKGSARIGHKELLIRNYE
jgi:DNA adenine methylase